MSGLRGGSTYSPGPSLQDMSIIADGGGHSWALHVCAHPGNSADTATPMRACLNVVDHAAHAGDAVALPPAIGGQLSYVMNRTANDISVWPAAGTTDAIYGGSGTFTLTPLMLPAGSTAMFVSLPGQWAITSTPPPPPDVDTQVPEAPTDGLAYVRSMLAWVNADARYYASSNPSSYINIGHARTGVSDGSDATAGQIGEYRTAQRLSTAALPLTTGTDAVVTSLALAAGDWDVWGSIGFTLTNNNQTFVSGWLNPAGSTRPSIDQMGGNFTVPVMSNQNSQVVSPMAALRVSSAAAVTVTLGATATFAGGGTCAAFGKIMARRVR